MTKRRHRDGAVENTRTPDHVSLSRCQIRFDYARADRRVSFSHLTASGSPRNPSDVGYWSRIVAPDATHQ